MSEKTLRCSEMGTKQVSQTPNHLEKKYPASGYLVNLNGSYTIHHIIWNAIETPWNAWTNSETKRWPTGTNNYTPELLSLSSFGFPKMRCPWKSPGFLRERNRTIHDDFSSGILWFPLFTSRHTHTNTVKLQMMCCSYQWCLSRSLNPSSNHFNKHKSTSLLNRSAGIVILRHVAVPAS